MIGNITHCLFFQKYQPEYKFAIGKQLLSVRLQIELDDAVKIAKRLKPILVAYIIIQPKEIHALPIQVNLTL